MRYHFHVAIILMLFPYESKSLAVSLPVEEMDLLHTYQDPTATELDGFGRSVSLSTDRVLVGAPGDRTSGIFVGQAHMFSAITGNLLQTFDDPTITSQDSFGTSVDLDDDRVLIGAPFDDSNEGAIGAGQVHLFNAVTGTLLQTFNDPTITNQDGFGMSVAIDGDLVVIGAPLDDTNSNNGGQAYLFNASTGALLHILDDPTPTRTDWFGQSVAVDGDHVLVGDPFDDTNGNGVGQAHLFDAATGAVVQTFNDPTITTFDGFGSSVAIDGHHALIGAPFDDTIGTDVGQAYLFDTSNGFHLQTFDDPTVTDAGEFGTSVAIDGDGVLVGAPRDSSNGFWVGQAHLFDANSGALLQTYNDPTATRRDLFGTSVALHGGRALVGAPNDDSDGVDVGQAHLYHIVPEPASLAILAMVSLFLFGASQRLGQSMAMRRQSRAIDTRR